MEVRNRKEENTRRHTDDVQALTTRVAMRHLLFFSLSPFHMFHSGGFLPWEFQPHAQIRGALHPLIFTLYYAIINIFGIDTRWAVVSLMHT